MKSSRRSPARDMPRRNRSSTWPGCCSPCASLPRRIRPTHWPSQSATRTCEPRGYSASGCSREAADDRLDAGRAAREAPAVAPGRHRRRRLRDGSADDDLLRPPGGRRAGDALRASRRTGRCAAPVCVRAPCGTGRVPPAPAGERSRRQARAGHPVGDGRRRICAMRARRGHRQPLPAARDRQEDGAASRHGDARQDGCRIDRRTRHRRRGHGHRGRTGAAAGRPGCGGRTGADSPGAQARGGEPPGPFRGRRRPCLRRDRAPGAAVDGALSRGPSGRRRTVERDPLLVARQSERYDRGDGDRTSRDRAAESRGSGSRPGNSPQAARGVRRTAGGGRADGDIHRGGPPPGRGSRPPPHIRTAWSRQDDSGARRRERDAGRPAPDRGARSRALRRPRGAADQPGAARRAVHRRDAPAEPGGRGDSLPRDGGLPDRHRHRRGPGGSLDQARSAAVHPRGRDHARRNADVAVARPVRHRPATRVLQRRRSRTHHHAVGRDSRGRDHGGRRRRDRGALARHAPHREPPPAKGARLRGGQGGRTGHGGDREPRPGPARRRRARLRPDGSQAPARGHRKVRRRAGGHRQPRGRDRGRARHHRGCARTVPHPAGIPDAHAPGTGRDPNRLGALRSRAAPR